MAGLFSFVFIFSFIFLILGLIKPSIFSRVLPKSRKIQSLVFGGTFILSIIIVGLTAPAPTTPQDIQETKQQTKGVSTVKISPEPIETVVPTQLPTATPTPTVNPKPTARSIKIIPTNTPVKSAPTNTPVPVNSAPAAVSQPSGGGYSCNCAKTCTQITTCEEAYFQLLNCGCSVRDGDDDGVPCEELC